MWPQSVGNTFSEVNKLIPDTLGQFTYLSWDAGALPESFRFEDVADKSVPRSTLSRLLNRAKSLGMVVEVDGVWTKSSER